MTTKPKARKFRIKRNVPVASQPAQPPAAVAPASAQGTAGAARSAAQPSRPRAVTDVPRPAPSSPKDTGPVRSGEVASASEVSGEQDMDAIRR
ncbi:hypothetical protein LCGC14_2762040, partial [marine sediment metagenome]